MGRKIKIHSHRWEIRANMIARNFCPPIFACKKCNNPYLEGYCCEFCEDTDPSNAKEIVTPRTNLQQPPDIFKGD